MLFAWFGWFVASSIASGIRPAAFHFFWCIFSQFDLLFAGLQKIIVVSSISPQFPLAPKKQSDALFVLNHLITVYALHCASDTIKLNFVPVHFTPEDDVFKGSPDRTV